MRGAAAVVALCVAAGAVAGCGGGPGSGAAAPSGPSVSSMSAVPSVSAGPTTTPLAGAPEPFEPCQAVPGEVLEANGFDPGSAAQDVLGELRTMRQCQWRTSPGVTWHNEWYSVAALRYEFDVGMLRQRGDLAGLREVAVNGRGGLVWWFPDDADVTCYVAFGTRTGRTTMVAVSMGIAAQVRPRVPGEPECAELVERHARWLEPYLPR